MVGSVCWGMTHLTISFVHVISETKVVVFPSFKRTSISTVSTQTKPPILLSGILSQLVESQSGGRRRDFLDLVNFFANNSGGIFVESTASVAPCIKPIIIIPSIIPFLGPVPGLLSLVAQGRI